jgi:UDP-galactose transporter B1
VLLFGNILTGRQWFGAVLVFSGLFADMIFGRKPTPSDPSSTIKNEKTVENLNRN